MKQASIGGKDWKASTSLFLKCAEAQFCLPINIDASSADFQHWHRNMVG